MIDSMRGIAAFSIVAYHLARQHPTGSGFDAYLYHLSFGITIFFLISGFLLYRPFLVANIEDRTLSVTHYALRRLARIGPGYWVALTLVALAGVGGAAVQANPLAYYGFGQIYLSSGLVGGIGQAWTLCVEVTFYALLPIAAAILALAWARRRHGWRWEVVGLMALVAISVVWNLVFPPTGGTPQRGAQFWLPSFLGQFAIGMSLAVLSVHVARGGSGGILDRWIRRRQTLPWLLVPILYFTAVKLDPGPLRQLIDGLAAAALIWPAIFAKPRSGTAGRLLALSPLIFAGVISYGVYLYHFGIITRLDGWLGIPADPSIPEVLPLIALTVAGSVAAGWLSWTLVERPAIRWSRRGRRHDKRIAVSARPS